MVGMCLYFAICAVMLITDIRAIRKSTDKSAIYSSLVMYALVIATALYYYSGYRKPSIVSGLLKLFGVSE